MKIEPGVRTAALPAGAGIARGIGASGRPDRAEGAPGEAARAGLARARATSQAERLRESSRALEGVFLNQLFKAMRETVPADGLFPTGPAEEMFTAMLDERMSQEAARRMRDGLGEALYKQLQTRLEAHGPKP